MTKRTWRGQENIPQQGAVILVANHISYADPLVVAHFVFDRPRMPLFLAKDSLFRLPIIGTVLRKVGQIPVQRGTADAGRALQAAVQAVRAGGAVIIYPEGTCTRDPGLWPMRGKSGVARVALTTGATVIPIAQWGAQRFHNPITRKLRLWPRTPVVVQAGPAIDLTKFRGQPLTVEVLQQATDVIMRRLRNDVASIRGEPAPEGPLYTPQQRAEPAQHSKAPS